MVLKRGSVVIELEDLIALPQVTVDMTRPGVARVRWDLRSAEVRGIALREGERIHVAISRAGIERLRRAVERFGARLVFLGASGGLAEWKGQAAHASDLALIVRQQLFRPGSLVAEIHTRGSAYGEKEEKGI